MATMTAPAAPTEAPQTTPPPDLYSYVLSLIDQLEPADQLQIVSHIVSSVQPLVAEPVEYDDDDDDEELIADAMEVLENTPDDAWLDWKDVKAELDRAEAAGELPD